jgi:hypothetical protein
VRKIPKTDWGNEIPSLKDAWKFVVENLGKVDVIPSYFGIKVALKMGGYNYIERDTLEECVADAERYRLVNRP